MTEEKRIRWTGEDYGRVEAIIARVDHMAKSMEDKWGYNRLEHLVDAELALKFGAAKSKFNNAVWKSEDPKQSELHGLALLEGYKKLDTIASENHQPKDPDVWEAKIDGKVYGIVKNLDEHSRVKRKYHAVYTVEELARLLEGSPQINAAKKAIPNAKITKVTPLEKIGDFDDEIPF